ncbi:MAG: hypothetical protein QOD13_808, partial [Thermoleophilaceae bacterium]|nr:hypothetical protein [Thermoleophilaceae bacterium]
MRSIDVWLRFVSWDDGQREDDRRRFVDQQRT